jgi:hypothetical protein
MVSMKKIRLINNLLSVFFAFKILRLYLINFDLIIYINNVVCKLIKKNINFEIFKAKTNNCNIFI